MYCVLVEVVEVELTWTSYTRLPATMLVFAIAGAAPKLTAFVQLAPFEPAPAVAALKPLSVAVRPEVTSTTEPNSA